VVNSLIDGKLLDLFEVWKEALADALRRPESETTYQGLADLERKIFDTPAHTALGVQIKLTLWRLYIDTPDGCDFREAAGLSAYSDLVRMTGRDLDAEIRALRREVIEAREAA
jgi:hypothetical protein